MILGPLKLPVIAINGMSLAEAWTYASHAVIEGKQRKQFVSKEAPNLSLSTWLHAEHIPVDQTIDQLRALADAHEVLVLQEPNGKIWGQFVIESLDTRPVWKLADGFCVCATVEIKLGDPGLEGGIVVPPLPVAVVGTKAATTSTPKAEGTSAGLDTVTPQQIARR
jgi:phage protein U